MKAVGPTAFRGCRHRVEHVELLGADGADRMAALGLAASVQPAFDAAWGGPAGMYARRLGPRRAKSMNPFADLWRRGVPTGGSSDANVTPLDPGMGWPRPSIITGPASASACPWPLRCSPSGAGSWPARNGSAAPSSPVSGPT